jgi:hypothetical protein
MSPPRPDLAGCASRARGRARRCPRCRRCRDALPAAGQSATAGMLPPSDSDSEEEEAPGEGKGAKEEAKAEEKPKKKAAATGGQSRNAGKLPPSGSEDEDEDEDDDGSDEESSEEAPEPAYLTQPSAPRRKWVLEGAGADGGGRHRRAAAAVCGSGRGCCRFLNAPHTGCASLLCAPPQFMCCEQEGRRRAGPRADPQGHRAAGDDQAEEVSASNSACAKRAGRGARGHWADHRGCAGWLPPPPAKTSAAHGGCALLNRLRAVSAAPPSAAHRRLSPRAARRREQDRLKRIKDEGWDRFAPISETNKP